MRSVAVTDVAYRVIVVNIGGETYNFLDFPEGGLEIREYEVEGHSMDISKKSSQSEENTETDISSANHGREIYPGDRTWRDL